MIGRRGQVWRVRAGRAEATLLVLRTHAHRSDEHVALTLHTVGGGTTVGWRDGDVTSWLEGDGWESDDERRRIV